MNAVLSVLFLALGTIFGFVLSRSGAADYDFIQRMFLFESVQLYGIIGTAVVITAPGLWLLQRHGRTLLGQPIKVELKPAHRGNIIGGVLFGVGWSIAGMCPGPIFVNIGEGKVYALATLAGALVGTRVFSAVYRRLQPALGLPALKVAPAR